MEQCVDIASRRGRFSHNLRIARCIFRAGLRSRLANRADFAMAVADGVNYKITIVIFAAVIFHRFPSLAGWSVGEILLISSIRLLGHGIYILFFGNVQMIPHLIREGWFDSFRLRPVSIFLQVCTHKVPINALGDLAVALASLSVCLNLLHLQWTFAKIVLLLLAVVGAIAIELALVLHVTSFVLRYPGTESLFYWLDTTISNFGNYPLTIFPKLLQGIFTFLMPVAFIAFYPAAWIVGKGNIAPFN